MAITIALAGNPNSGKSTLFNGLTGSNQYVGNWPGVTVEKKTGKYKKDKEVHFTDLPGIYSLSPYTLEEVVSRDYLVNEKPDAIIDVVDATNIERNLFLATQLVELGIPVVIALNMMDVVKKNNDYIDIKKLEKSLGCKIVEISALKNENIDKLIDVAKSVAMSKETHYQKFDDDIEKYIEEIENFSVIKDNPAKRWLAVKLFEQDEKIINEFPLYGNETKRLDEIVEEAEEKFDDDGEGIITDGRYNFVSKITKDAVKKGRKGMTKSDKIDRFVTNRFLAIPIFVGIITLVYMLAINVVGGPVTDWVNDVFFGEIIGENFRGFLENAGTSEFLTSLLVDGIIGGVGAVLGFLPVIAVLFLFISILEDVGYMSRIAFILDRIFRRFGLSGKSFIPILMGTGCSVPAIMATRTIESDNDRRMTIMTTSFMPCGAKLDIIAMFAAFLGGSWWYAPIWYFGGIMAVIISGIILKKTKYFSGDPAPFVMELPEYHMPSAHNVLKATWHRCKAFVVKAGTIILLATVAIWFLKNISVTGEFMDFDRDPSDSVLAAAGKVIAPIFKPLGFGNWIASVSTILGLVAKEVVVGTYGVLAGIGEVGAEDAPMVALVSSQFTVASAFAFVFFNQLTVPCFAATGAIKEEMGSRKWYLFAIVYQILFSYTIAFMIYQFGRVIEGGAFNVGTAIAIVVLFIYGYFLFRKDRSKLKNKDFDHNKKDEVIKYESN
ncbi:ferrous iron transport protein B [Peptoniphilus rhinitidis]|uniref:ferrous iron transport protein B n=1 Tax=Peptoniphilus TaxID=162289 RepID=UPI002903CAB8|nr:ferrous iron transport protein B [Peptoniphilus rhinitidis]MDU1043677.1 ferrous iron transport protein B [Peptoniphilus rhinitidis]MDU2109304.1 ferrous iron transport protein B [Peptoniphilus lacydonensis]MDU3751036.1 ferrous iron transport protein B [Peptoniphilus rhinitidis]